MKPSERCTKDADLMHAFREAYVDLVNHAKPVNEYPFLVLKPATDNVTWQRKRSLVAGAAGIAGIPYARYGGTLTMRNAAVIMRDVDPVTNWEMSLRDPEQMAPEVVISAVDAAIARARQAAREAAERERGLIGLIAAFLRWPSDLREAVGSGHPVQRRAASALGLVGQVLVGAIAAALATGLVAGVVALWRMAF